MTRSIHCYTAWTIGLILLISTTSCSAKVSQGQLAQSASPTATGVQSGSSEVSPTPFSPAEPTQTLSPTSDPGFSLWVDPALPETLKASLHLPGNVSLVDATASPAPLRISAKAEDGNNTTLKIANWVYALVAPFPTVPDGVTSDELKAVWQGKSGATFDGHPLLMDEKTKLALEELLGPAGDSAVITLPAGQLLDEAWNNRPSWAVIPFESVEPKWKVLRIDGQSPLDKDFDTAKYPLIARFSISGPTERINALKNQLAGDVSGIMADTNRDPSKLTTVIMTGVTALVRATAWKMDTLGVDYPGRDIGDWLRAADIAHVSNEISFDARCPPGNPSQLSLQFCSRPEYLKLFEDVGIDVVELTGNHVNDYSRAALNYTLDLYQQQHIQYFAGGHNLAEAEKPLLITQNGNKIAFIGCNPPGPDYAWATEKGAGAAPCGDMQWELQTIRDLKAQGYLVIATFQYNESYDYVPGPAQRRDFRKVSEAGAVVVSGSQAHYPQAFEFDGDNFIHYGLGNLFFDQMDPIIDGRRIYGTEREFLDRHVFYNGHYLGVDLLTAMLEDYARPRPMTADERQSLLKIIFEKSGW